MSVVNMLPQGGSLTAELLWTNPSPTTGTTGFSLNLDLKNYTAVIIEARALNDNSNSSLSYITKGATGSKAFIFAWVSVRRLNGRDVTTFNDTNITFGNGFVGASGNNSSNACIPTKIYGVKVKGVS